MAPPARPPLLVLAPLFLLLLPTLASSTTTTTTITTVPSNATSAQHTWRGLRQPNYETLYTQYELPLACIRNAVPLGVLGFYGWLADLVVSLSNAAAAAGRLRSTSNKRKMAASCAANSGLVIAHYSLRLYILLTTAAGCSGVVSVDFESLLDSALSVSAIGACYSIVTALGVVLGPPALRSAVAIVAVLTVLFHLLGTAIYYPSYASFLYIDESLLRPIMAVGAVPIFLIIGYLLALLVFGCARNKFYALCWFIAAAAAIFHVVGTGIADVVLGRIVGDVYGVQELGTGLGNLDLVLACVFPVASILAAALQFV